MNSTPIVGAAWMTKKAMNEVLRKARQLQFASHLSVFVHI
jgi:hypothetical protein